MRKFSRTKSASIMIYRGTHQIGGCVTEIQVGDNRIVIDFGANLPENHAVNVLSDDEIVKAVFPDNEGEGKVCGRAIYTLSRRSLWSL